MDESPRSGQVVPDIVIAPAHPANKSSQIVFEVRPGAAGTDVLPVFSSVRQLVETLGPAQPWVALPLRKARELAAAGGIQQVVLDPVAPPGTWRWGYSDLETLTRDLA
ncbi:MAG TPA: SAV_915 family protein [Streptosporangiaceae bacterium]|nr:SAV_915 family protein [Streptosporangiaceae bacterium]